MPICRNKKFWFEKMLRVCLNYGEKKEKMFYCNKIKLYILVISKHIQTIIDEF
jgi:hypothetical protein